MFSYSDTNKRYHTYDYYLKHRYGQKVAKLPIDAGFSCPNLDGKCGSGGCIYCSPRGSGDFASDKTLSVTEQMRLQREKLGEKWNSSLCIAYFQARTNTYAPVEILRERFEEALRFPGVVGLNIATRADCLPGEVLEYLSELSYRTDLTVELGLQSSDDQTAKEIGRGHTYADFCRGFADLRRASPKIRICVHLIFGLPNEGRNEMMQTVRDVATLHPDEVKIHLLHVLKHTPLAARWEAGEYLPMEKADYVSSVADAIELLPADIVVSRVTGDGKAEDLLAPLWSRDKRSVLNAIDQTLAQRKSTQGAKIG